MCRVKLAVLALLITPMLLGCNKDKEVSIADTFFADKEVIYEAMNSNEHLLIYKDDDKYYKYNCETKEESEVTLRSKNQKEALSYTPIEYKGDTTDDITPMIFKENCTLVAPGQYQINESSRDKEIQGKYLGYITACGYHLEEEYRSDNYVDLLYKKLGSNIRIILQEDTINIFLDSQEKDYTPETYINEKKE